MGPKVNSRGEVFLSLGSNEADDYKAETDTDADADP